jgi:1,4-dihydroxy-2-naphthoyl-CoA hydrolase
MNATEQKKIWFTDYSAEGLNPTEDIKHVGTLLGIRFTEIGPDYIKATMPVDERHRQPAGLLHGGVSVVLAETLGSVASYLCIDVKKYTCVGLEVNANHMRPVREGLITGTCTPIHLGKSTHVWDIRIHTEKGKLVCVSRLTVAIVPLENMMLNYGM